MSASSSSTPPLVPDEGDQYAPPTIGEIAGLWAGLLSLLGVAAYAFWATDLPSLSAVALVFSAIITLVAVAMLVDRVKYILDCVRRVSEVHDPATRIDVETLTADILDPIRTLLRPGTRYLTPDQLRSVYTQATALMAERERYTRQERDTIAQRTEYEQTRATEAYLQSLSQQERALFERRIHARAAAEARAARDVERLERENAALRDACQRFAEFHGHNNSHKG
jgi:hypothetical protein